jgi:hypothetical protein
MSKESTQHATIATDVPELITLFIGLESTEETSAESNRTKATVLLGEHFPSFTITEGTGFFRGAREPVLLVHIATPTPQEVAEVAGLIRVALKQEGVGIGYRGRYFRAIEGHIPQLNRKESSHA